MSYTKQSLVTSVNNLTAAVEHEAGLAGIAQLDLKPDNYSEDRDTVPKWRGWQQIARALDVVIQDNQRIRQDNENLMQYIKEKLDHAPTSYVDLVPPESYTE